MGDHGGNVAILYPGAPPSEAPQPGPRLYHSPSMPQFQTIKRRVEQEWVPALQRLLDIDTEHLPMLWDCDFLFGPKRTSGEDTYVLCEINVSSVTPFPESAPPYIADAVLARIHQGGIQSIETGPLEAADSLGLNDYQKMRLVVSPQAIRRILPPPVEFQPAFYLNTFNCQSAPALIICLTGLGKTDNS